MIRQAVIKICDCAQASKKSSTLSSANRTLNPPWQISLARVTQHKNRAVVRKFCQAREQIRVFTEFRKASYEHENGERA
jgi:hypothetical protein